MKLPHLWPIELFYFQRITLGACSIFINVFKTLNFENPAEEQIYISALCNSNGVFISTILKKIKKEFCYRL